MFMSALWDTIFEMNGKHAGMSVFLIDNHIPALAFGNMKEPTVYLAGFGEEWQTGKLMLRFFDELISNYETDGEMAGVRVKKAMGEHGIILIPAVCPEKSEKCEEISVKDLLPIAKYLRFHKIGLAFTVSAKGKSIACFESGEKSKQSIGEILSACSKLPIDNRRLDEKSEFCRWINEVVKIPAFNVSLDNFTAAASDYTYKTLEETLLISALI